MHKRVRDAFDDAPHAREAYVSTELRLPEREDLINNPEVRYSLSVGRFGLETRKYNWRSNWRLETGVTGVSGLDYLNLID